MSTEESINYIDYSFALLLYTLIILSHIILFLIAIINILKSKFESDINKLIWLLAVLLMPLIGSVLYFFIGRKQRQKSP